MFNLVVLTGRLTADPELKTTPNGISVTSFSIAVSRRYRSGEETQADFINIVAWRQNAEFITKYFKKGNMIGIEGAIQTRRYTDKNGNNRTAFEIVADTPHFGMGNGGSNNNAQNEGFSELPDDTEFPDDLDFPPLN